jgi:hypothetical protein
MELAPFQRQKQQSSKTDRPVFFLLYDFPKKFGMSEANYDFYYGLCKSY